MTDRKAVIRIISLLLFMAFLAGSAHAEVFRPLQILLPGNLAGNLATFDRNLKITPDLCWRITGQLDSFRKLKDKDCLVIAPGNDSSIYSPVNYLFRGELERELIGRCRPDAWGTSPADLEMFAGSGLSQEIRQRVWTNHETIDRQTLFTPFTTHKVGNQRIWYFNFISPEYCRHLPLSNWGNFAADGPQRSLRRLNLNFTDNDITVSTVHLDRNEIELLLAEFKQTPGWHLVIQVASPDHPAIFSTSIPEQQGNTWLMSIENGHTHLPQVNIFRRNNGYPRLTLRRLAFSKVRSQSGDELFRIADNKIRQSIVKPLHVVKPSFQASTASFRFAGKMHARLIRQTCSSDVTFLRVPPTQHLVDNVICTGHILSTMENDRIHSFRLSGKELFDLASALVKNSDTHPTAVAGCEVTWFAGRITSLNVAGQPCRSDRHYLISTTELTLQDTAIRNLALSEKLRGYEGETLWKVWMNTLKSHYIADEQLVEQP